MFGSNIPGPKEIPLPDFKDPSDYVTKIECGKRNSAIITNEGEVWIAGNYKPDKATKDAILKDKEEERKRKGSLDIEEFMTKEKKG